MPNIKTAKKRVLVNEKKNSENTMIRSELRTIVKNVKKLAGDGKTAEATEMLNVAFAKIDKAASKNIIHANKAARMKATLSKSVINSKDVVIEVKKAPVKKVAVKAEVKPVAPSKKAKTTAKTEEVKPAAKTEETKPAAKKTAAKK